MRLLCSRRRGLSFRFWGWLGGRLVRSRWRRPRFCWLRMSSRLCWLSAPFGSRRSGICPRRRSSRLSCRLSGLSCGLCGLSCFPHGFSGLCRSRSRACRCRSRLGTIGLRVRRRRRSCWRCGAGRNYGSDWFACGDGLRRCNNSRFAVINGGKLLVVLCCRLLLL